MDLEKYEGRRWLNPLDRSTEALFGIIVTLTFTSSLSVLNDDPGAASDMWKAALYCNLAWGVVDACFFLMGALTARGRRVQLVRRLRVDRGDEAVAQAFAEVMPERMVHLMTPSERSALCERIIAQPDSSREPWLTAADLKGALGVLLWVFLITFPLVLPFFFIQDVKLALRTSNIVAIVLLGLIGWRIAQYTGFSVVRAILYLVLFGILMVAITIALGG